MSSFNPDLQFKDTKSVIRNRVAGLFTEFKDIKFVTASFLEYEKIESYEKVKCTTSYWSSKAQRSINEDYIDSKTYYKASNK